MEISITYLFKNIWSKLKQVKLVYYQNNKKVWKSDGLATTSLCWKDSFEISVQI